MCRGGVASCRGGNRACIRHINDCQAQFGSWESLPQAGRPHQAQEVLPDDQESAVQAVILNHGECLSSLLSRVDVYYLSIGMLVI